MELYDLNVAAILVAALAAFVIGFLWHGPVFGAQWIKMMKIPKAEVDAMQAKGMGPMLPSMAMAFVQHVVMATVLAYLIDDMRVASGIPSVILALVLWLGFIVTTLLNGVLWEKRTVELYIFNLAYHLVTLVVMALIVGAWR